MNIVDPALEEYMFSLTPARHPTIAAMEALAAEKEFPIIGPLVGRFLQQIVCLTGARRVFEMGSGFGYSAIWFALALPKDGIVYCTENDPDNIARGRDFAAQAGVADRIEWREGDAMAHMQAAAGPFDIILIDVDKDRYPEALEDAWPKLRPAGVLVTDNTLWSGRIVEEQPPSDSTQGVLQFNKDAYALPDGLATIMPLRDGLLLAVKTGKGG
jgi:predicted O-methyltransferase YrrM